MKWICFLTVAILILSGCASRPVTRGEIPPLPPLDSKLSRVYVSAGVSSGIKLWSVHQVGPVYIKDQQVGSTAKDEHFVIDISPGNYEASCTPEQPEKNYSEKRLFTFKEGETRQLACDMEPKGAGIYFGLIGVLASEYITKTYLTERPLDSNSKLVAYNRAH